MAKKQQPASNANQLPSHPAVAAFVDVLGALGSAATDLNDTSAKETVQQCQHWISRVQADETEPRSWDEARQFAVKLIGRERDFAIGRFDDFRQMIWIVIQGLRDAFRDEQMADDEVFQHLGRLRGAVASDSIDELRNEVVAAVVLISRAMDDRKKRQQLQLEELGAQLNRMRSELMQAQKEMALDPMTRLYNRASFDQLLVKTIELSLFSGQSSCLLMLDIDHFKQINDQCGHVCGDQAVVLVADCLRQTFPRKTDFVARYGGDEFAVILQDTELKDGEMLAKRLLTAVSSKELVSDGEPVTLSLSIGVAALKKESNAKVWVMHADQALYQAKRAGRGCVWLSKD